MGPLRGFRVIELAGIGPAPFCAMMLGDLGAEVIRIERPGTAAALDPERNILDTGTSGPLGRNRRSIAVNLKTQEGVELVLSLLEGADCLLEGFRPGVMERLGLAPATCLARNPRLVIGRMTGWGQDGPLAHAAGHDGNYLALTGALQLAGREGEPPVPMPVVLGDMGGGGMYLAAGVLAAMLEAARSGEGQVVDAAIVDGAALLMAPIYSIYQYGHWRRERGANHLDGGSHFYNAYETADGKWVFIGAIEPQFYAELRERLGLAGDPDFDAHHDPAAWPALKQRLAAVFRTRTQAEWIELLEGTDACFGPVLAMDEAPDYPFNRARGTFIDVAGVRQPAPGPRFGRTPAAKPAPPPVPGADTAAVLRGEGLSEATIAGLAEAGIIELVEP